MSRRARIAIFVPALLGLAALLFWSVVDLPSFGNYRGPYGDVLNRVAVPERHTTNVVGATVFDYRGVDTLGEEFILFASVIGVVLLLRTAEREAGEGTDSDSIRSDALRLVGVLAAGAVTLVGLWLVAFGYITPGGGFQGGIVIASGVLLVYLASSYRSWRRMTSERLFDPIGSTGAGGYVVVGLAALIAGTPFLHNLLGPGQSGTLFSGGSIAFLNWASALEVAAANVVLYAEFLEEYIVPIARGRE
jgi:multicomponent Na+:H+ antiporter subunit B